jgi:hypothetical protein
MANEIQGLRKLDGKMARFGTGSEQSLQLPPTERI